MSKAGIIRTRRDPTPGRAYLGPVVSTTKVGVRAHTVLQIRILTEVTAFVEDGLGEFLEYLLDVVGPHLNDSIFNEGASLVDDIEAGTHRLARNLAYEALLHQALVTVISQLMTANAETRDLVVQLRERFQHMEDLLPHRMNVGPPIAADDDDKQPQASEEGV